MNFKDFAVAVAGPEAERVRDGIQQRRTMQALGTYLGQGADAGLADIYKQSPQAGMQAEQQTRQRQQQVAEAVRYLDSVPEDKRAIAYQGLVPQLQRAFPGQQIPPTWGPEVENALVQVRALTAGAGQSGTELPSEIRTLEYLRANPHLMDVNDRLRGTNTFQEVINADGTKSYVALNNRTASGAIAPIGAPQGQPMQPQQAPQQPQRTYTAQFAPGQEQDPFAQLPEQEQALAMRLAEGGMEFTIQNGRVVPAGRAQQPQGQPPQPQAQPVNRPIPPLSQWGAGDERGGRGLGQTDAQRAQVAANEAAQTRAATLETDLAYADRLAAAEANAARLKQEAEAAGERSINLPNVIAEADQTISLLDKAINHPGRATATGLSGRIDPRNIVPGTAAMDFKVVLDQLGGRAFLQAFESLKGGGQITEIEGRKATEAMARLNTAQSDEEFVLALRELRDLAQVAKDRAIRGTSSGNPQPQQAQQPGRIRYDAQGNRI